MTMTRVGYSEAFKRRAVLEHESGQYVLLQSKMEFPLY